MSTPSKSQPQYLHGYSTAEQLRLLRQAAYWRHTLVPLGLSYRPGQRLLEVGCAAGATLGVLSQQFPGLRIAGIDLEPRQIEFARAHLASLGVRDADLRVGDGAKVPWPDASFDHVFMMWLVEHLRDPMPILREARRVLRPGGTIALTETDYTTFKVLPPSADFDYLAEAQHAHFSRHGNPHAGRELGTILVRSGFANVRSAPVGFHTFNDGTSALREHVTYVAEFMEPALDQLAALGFERERLDSGLECFKRLPEIDGASFTTIVYRGHGEKV